jgi:hypothetical protein
MLAKGPPTSHSFLKIIAQKTILKVFLTLTYIMTQSRCKLRKVLIPKWMVS